MSCECKKDGSASIPYFAYESEMARSERHIKRLIIALIVTVAAIFASNAAWLYAWCQYDYIGIGGESVIEINGEDALQSASQMRRLLRQLTANSTGRRFLPPRNFQGVTQ